MYFNYDVIVIGGGHAGCEAAVVSARMLAQKLLRLRPTWVLRLV